MLQTFLKTAAVLVGYLIAADVIGVVACVIFDVAPLRYDSGGLPYAIWFVLGVFTGFLVLGTAGALASAGGDESWMDRPGSKTTANRVLASSLLILLVLCCFFYRIYWSQGVAGEYFVPDSAPHTITFVISIMGAMLIGRSLTTAKTAS